MRLRPVDLTLPLPYAERRIAVAPDGTRSLVTWRYENFEQAQAFGASHLVAWMRGGAR